MTFTPKRQLLQGCEHFLYVLGLRESYVVCCTTDFLGLSLYKKYVQKTLGWIFSKTAP